MVAPSVASELTLGAMAYGGWGGPGVRLQGLEFHLSQAPDDVAELGLGADPAQEARQGSLRRRAARA